MIDAILAGITIALAAIINLNIENGIIGATFFAIGLIAVLIFQFNLFTGKAGLLITKEIKPIKLLEIWIGNFFGVGIIALLYLVALITTHQSLGDLPQIQRAVTIV